MITHGAILVLKFIIESLIESAIIFFYFGRIDNRRDIKPLQTLQYLIKPFLFTSQGGS